jgi:hypothetical protein
MTHSTTGRRRIHRLGSSLRCSFPHASAIMYGGLFGDLPATKGDSTQDGQHQTGSSSETPDESKPVLAVESLSQREDANATTILPAVKKLKTGLAQSIGTAGTSMAFIPTTIKRKKYSSKVPLLPPKAQPAVQPLEINTKHVESSIAAASFVSTRIVEKAPQQPGPVDIHAQQQLPAVLSEDTGNHNTLSRPTDTSATNPFTNDEAIEDQKTITDPYDPYVPNDLLQYWDRQALKEQRRQLELEAQQAMEHQKLLRKRLEEEREELQRQGNLQKLDTGRGRGVSNLPAWLVAKQQQDRLGESA